MTKEIVISVSNRTEKEFGNGIQSKLNKIAPFTLPAKVFKAYLELYLVENAEMQELNRERRGKDKTTDVLSFPLGNSINLPEILLGEVWICLDELERQAREIGHSEEDEFDRLLVHGYLHLIGFDHELGEREAKEMQEMEDRCMNCFDEP